MEVDEAANHIRELVDEDANIIWGSAFNENLNGRIRVSVVATGIDSEARSPEASSRSFAFDRTPKPAAAPVSSIYNSISEPAAEAPMAAADLDEASTVAVADEESPVSILMGNEIEDANDVSAEDISDENSETAEDDDEMLELGSSNLAEDEASGGGTLFERMSNLSRGLTSSDDEDAEKEESPSRLNIPRFLDRQGNN
jgi:cell division protein FtsZ